MRHSRRNFLGFLGAAPIALSLPAISYSAASAISASGYTIIDKYLIRVYDHNKFLRIRMGIW